jgi:hypothetical protein
MSRSTVEQDRAADHTKRGRRRRKTHPLMWVLGVVVIAALILILVVKAGSSSSARKDVALGTCTAGDDRPEASGTIRNHSSKRSNYVIHVRFTDPQGNTVADGASPVTGVAPGELARWNATGERHADGPMKCDLSVSRTAVPGN